VSGHSSESKFSHHGPCTSCGSKDNVAWYAGAGARLSGFCFGCGKFYREAGQGLPELASAGANTSGTPKVGAQSEAGVRPLADDIGHYYPLGVVEWVQKYHLTPTDLIRNNVFWSPKNEQLFYVFYGVDKEVVLWQARNFRATTTHKSRFFTSGSTADVIAAYYPEQDSDSCCIVEDCVSGIRVSQAGRTGVPCFSASMPSVKLTRLARMYRRIDVWLDSDKFKEAVGLSRKIQTLGYESRVIHTTEDPKCYTVEQVKEIFGDETVA